MRVSLLAIHGNGGGGERFEWIRPHLPDHLDLHAPTLPGFGGVPADPACDDVAGYAAVVAQHLLALPRPRVLLGSGIGGSFALEVLRHHHGDVDGVILHAPVGPRLDTRLVPRVVSRPMVAEGIRRAIASRPLRPLIAARFFDRRTPRDRVDAVLDAYADCTVFGQQFQIITADWWASLEPRHTPAIVLWGAEERVLDVAMADEVREVLPEADIRTIDGWDHFPMIDDPAGFTEVLADAVADLVVPTTRR